MHPALSTIIFTVTSGAGYGLLILLALARVAGLVPVISANQVVMMGLVGLLLVTVGLIASTFHLANPKNAWRSFSRFRTSWLSREAVFAVLFYPVCLSWLFLEWSGGFSTTTASMGVITAVLAIVVLVCTSMIYASLKTIRQWNNALTPVNYVLLGMMLGALFLLLMCFQQGLGVSRLLSMTVLFVLLAALAKLVYFVWIGQPAGPTINTALGFTRATVRLLDVGHASDTFLTKEFGYQVARAKLIWLRIICIATAFVIPFLLVSGIVGTPGVLTLIVASISAYAGVFLERWLFFAEARHVVNLYHGLQRT